VKDESHHDPRGIAGDRVAINGPDEIVDGGRIQPVAAEK